MKYYIKKEDAERYRNMSKEQREKILNQIEDIEESCKKQMESIQKLKAFFSGKTEVRK